MLQKHTWNETKSLFLCEYECVCVQNVIVFLSIVYGDIIENGFRLRLCDAIEFTIHMYLLSDKSVRCGLALNKPTCEMNC